MNRISIKTLIGAEICFRSSADLIRPRLVAGGENVIDLKGVDFISRSFADELYNLQLDYDSVRFENAAGDVEKMMQAVWKGRGQKRVRPATSIPIIDKTSVEAFSEYLLSI